MSKHTKGPWTVSHGCLPGDSGFSIGSDNAASKNVKITAECWPCTIVSEEHRQELFANAKLIAAAPDLLDALQEANEVLCMVSFVVKNRPEKKDVNHAIDRARAAIAKATK